MPQTKAARVFTAYFDRPTKEYVRTVESIRVTGGLSLQDIEEMRGRAASVHVEAILRHLEAEDPKSCQVE